MAAQGDWIPIKSRSAWPGATAFIGPAYEPGQLLNPVQPALRNLGPGNKGVGVGLGRGR